MPETGAVERSPRDFRIIKPSDFPSLSGILRLFSTSVLNDAVVVLIAAKAEMSEVGK